LKEVAPALPPLMKRSGNLTQKGSSGSFAGFLKFSI
jgi:hypothetical protein